MKNLATAYMARRYARGGKVKSKMAMKPMSDDAHDLDENGMCMAHGGSCMAGGGEVNPKLEESHMFEGGDVDGMELEDHEEMGKEISGDNDEDMRNDDDLLLLGSNENEMGDEDERVKMARGGMAKKHILSKILGGISKMHKGM